MSSTIKTKRMAIVHIPSDLFTAGSHTLAVEVHISQCNKLYHEVEFNLPPSLSQQVKSLRLSWYRPLSSDGTTENSRTTLLSAADTLDPDREWKPYLKMTCTLQSSQ